MDFIVNFVQVTLAEASIFLLLLGLVLFLLGTTVLLLSAHTWLTGRRTLGKVVGAIKETRIKEKQRDGKTVKETKETLWPIYEYENEDGSLRQEKGSSGGSSVKNYATGQSVKLIVCSRGEYDDVYDRSDKSPLILGAAFFGIGFAIMAWTANFYASLQLGTFFSVIVAAIVLFKIITGKKKKTPHTGEKKHHKHFNPEDVRPIEDFNT